MKKRFACVVALLLLAALAVPALASDWHMYAQEDDVKVYAEKDRNSKVVKTLEAGEQVTIEDVSKSGKWYAILYEKKGKQRVGWVQEKYLGDNPPPSACDHQFGKWQVVSEATCTQSGYRVRYCKKCGLMEEEAVPKLGHTYGAWKVTKEATCTVAGERTRTCKVCGHQEKEEIIEPHTFGDWTIAKEATCTEEGQRVRRCKVCGLEEKKAIETIPHSYGEWAVAVEATDHTSGVRARTCTMCGAAQRERYDPEGTLRRGDRGDAVREVQQLLFDQGYLKGSTVDGIFGGGMEKSVMQFQQDQGLEPDGVVWPQTIKRLNHDFGDWETVTMPTRFTEGVRVRVCRDCGYEQREVVSPGTTYEPGSRGEHIRELQQMLADLGYDPGAADGIYGRKLDSAFAAFSRDNGMAFAAGEVLPGNVDALLNAWLDAQSPDTWRGEGDLLSPVNLALTVNLRPGGDVADDMSAFDWTLTNLGSEKCAFCALLLTYGDRPDFKGNDLAVSIEAAELRPGGENSASGSFSVASDWGEGSLNFAALAVVDGTGERWLSNTVSFEREGASASAGVVAPIPVSVDVAHLADGVYPVSFDVGDVLSGASGVFMNAVHVYSEDTYDPVEVNLLAPGDTIVVRGEPIMVETVTRDDGFVVVNDDEYGVGCALWLRGDAYVIAQDDDMPTYTEHGVTTLVVDPSAVFTDAWDPERDPVSVSYPGIVAALQDSGMDLFDAFNTTVRIENGRVVEIVRVYTP